jgi:phosphohistidine phosphatase
VKGLTLLRHAKSEWDAPVAGDFDRPLNGRGRKAARAMGREMRARGLEFDRVVASPAIRIVETMEGVAEGYGHRLEADSDPRVYLASVATLLKIVREADDRDQRLLIVGHNPGMEQLALLLTRGGALRDQLAVKFPTGALAEISLPIARWRDAAEGEGTLARFIRPRDLDPALGPEE